MGDIVTDVVVPLLVSIAALALYLLGYWHGLRNHRD